MKKVLKVLSVAMLAAAVAASAATVTSAVSGINADEQRIMDELNTTVTMAGVEKSLPDSYKNQAENYLNQDDVDLSSTEADNVIAKVEETKAYIESTGVAHISEMTDDQFNQLAGLVKETAAAGGAEVTVAKSDDYSHPADIAIVTNGTPEGPGEGGNNVPNGNGDNNYTPSGNKTPVDNNPIKTTGFDVPSVTAVAGVGVLMVAAAGIYLMKTSKKESADA